MKTLLPLPRMSNRPNVVIPSMKSLRFDDIHRPWFRIGTIIIVIGFIVGITAGTLLFR